MSGPTSATAHDGSEIKPGSYVRYHGSGPAAIVIYLRTMESGRVEAGLAGLPRFTDCPHAVPADCLVPVDAAAYNAEVAGRYRADAAQLLAWAEALDAKAASALASDP